MGFWEYKTFCLVTGASRGIGKTIAVEFAKKFKTGSVILIMARSVVNLQEAKDEVISGAPHVQCVSTIYDFSRPDKDEFRRILKAALTEVAEKEDAFEHAFLVHNAGTLGDISRRTLHFESLDDLRVHFDENLFSPILLSTQFFKIFEFSTQKTMLQITSRASVDALPNLGMYSSSKAARDMLMRSVAAEEPGIMTLSYAPGPVDTRTFHQFATEIGNPEVKDVFKTMIENGQVLTPEMTVAKLIEILTAEKLKSGDRADFFETSV